MKLNLHHAMQVIAGGENLSGRECCHSLALYSLYFVIEVLGKNFLLYACIYCARSILKDKKSLMIGLLEVIVET